MPELPPHGLQIASEIAQIAAAPGRIEERAEALLEPLHRLVPFEGAMIRLIDPDRDAPAHVVDRGFDTTVSGYFTGPVIADEIEMLGFTRQRTALRMADLPIPMEQVSGWRDYLRPAGFREGLTVGMFNRGHYLGILGLYTDTLAHPTEAARDLLTALAPVLATAIDPLRSIDAVARLVADAYAGVVLTRGGNTLSLPGLPGHPRLCPGSDTVAAAAERISAGRIYGSFLWPDPAGETGCHTMITTLACPSDSPHSLLAILLLSPPGELHGLTPRELQILGLLIEGWPNRRIAAALFVTPRTVATHVEHILTKLHAPTRTLAAVRAQRLGLYVPGPLSGSQ